MKLMTFPVVSRDRKLATAVRVVKGGPFDF